MPTIGLVGEGDAVVTEEGGLAMQGNEAHNRLARTLGSPR